MKEGTGVGLAGAAEQVAVLGMLADGLRAAVWLGCGGLLDQTQVWAVGNAADLLVTRMGRLPAAQARFIWEAAEACARAYPEWVPQLLGVSPEPAHLLKK